MTDKFRFGLRRPFYFDQSGTESSVKNDRSSDVVGKQGASGDEDDTSGKYSVDSSVNDYINYMTDSFIGSLHHLIMDDRKPTANDNDRMYADARTRYKDFYKFAKDHSIKNNNYQEDDYKKKFLVPKDWEKTKEKIPTMTQQYVKQLLEVYEKVQIQDFKFTVHTGQNNKIPEFNQLYTALYYLALFCSLLTSDKKWLSKRLKCGTFGEYTFEDIYNKAYEILRNIHQKLFNTKELGFDKINIKDNNKAEKPEEGPTDVTAAAKEAEPKSSNSDGGKAEENVTFKWYEAAKKKFNAVCEAQRENKSSVWSALTRSVVYNVLNKLFTDSSLYKTLDNYKKTATGTRSSVNNCYQKVFYGNHRRVAQARIGEFYEVKCSLNEKDNSAEDPTLSKHWVGEHRKGRIESSDAYSIIEETRKLVDKSIKDFFKKNDTMIDDRWKVQATIVWYLTYLLAKLANSDDTEVEDGKTADEKLAADWLNKMYMAFKNGKIRDENNSKLTFQSENSGCRLYRQQCQDKISSTDEKAIKDINDAYARLLNPGRKAPSKEWKSSIRELLGPAADRVLSWEAGLYSGGEPGKDKFPYAKGLAAIIDYMDDLYTKYEKTPDTGIDRSNSGVAYKAFSLYVLLCQKYSGWTEKDVAFYNVFYKRLTFKSDGSIVSSSRRGREVRALT